MNLLFFSTLLSYLKAKSNEKYKKLSKNKGFSKYL